MEKKKFVDWYLPEALNLVSAVIAKGYSRNDGNKTVIVLVDERYLKEEYLDVLGMDFVINQNHIEFKAEIAAFLPKREVEVPEE